MSTCALFSVFVIFISVNCNLSYNNKSGAGIISSSGKTTVAGLSDTIKVMDGAYIGLLKIHKKLSKLLAKLVKVLLEKTIPASSRHT